MTHDKYEVNSMRVTTEIGTLREAGMFGPPGVESYLAQFYAPKESLFFEQFDIAKARAEFSTYADILHLLDVEVKDLRSAYAMSCMGDGLTMESLIRKLHEKQPKADLATIEQILHEEAGFYGRKGQSRSTAD